MGIRSMAQDLVDHNGQAEPVGLGNEVIEVRERPEHGVNVAVRGDIVAEVLHGRREERRDPDAVHAEASDVFQALANALEIADAIAVAVGEAARIDLVDDAAAPPWRRRAHSAGFLLVIAKS